MVGPSSTVAEGAWPEAQDTETKELPGRMAIWAYPASLTQMGRMLKPEAEGPVLGGPGRAKQRIHVSLWGYRFSLLFNE